MAASRYVAPPGIAPHTADAAVDITLADTDGHELQLGTSTNATPERSNGACYMDAGNISAEGRGAPPHPRLRPYRSRARELPDRVVALVLRRPLLGPHDQLPGGVVRADLAPLDSMRAKHAAPAPVPCIRLTSILMERTAR